MVKKFFRFDLIEKLFDIARRVPFLAMTIIEKNGIDNPWLFRTQPLQTGQTQSMREVPLQLAPIPTPVPAINHHHQSITPHEQHQQQLQRQHHHQQQQQQQQQQQKQHPKPPPVPPAAVYTQQNQRQQQQQQQLRQQQQHQQQQQQQQQQRLQQVEYGRPRAPTGPIPIDPKKVVKSSTAPNLPTSNSLSEMFRVI